MATGWKRAWARVPHNKAARRWKRFVRRALHKKNRKVGLDTIEYPLDGQRLA